MNIVLILAEDFRNIYICNETKSCNVADMEFRKIKDDQIAKLHPKPDIKGNRVISECTCHGTVYFHTMPPINLRAGTPLISTSTNGVWIIVNGSSSR